MRKKTNFFKTLRFKKISIFVCLLIFLAACGSLEDENQGPIAETEIPLHRQSEIPVSRGFVDGKQIEFYKFSAFVPQDANWFPQYEKFPGMPVNEMYIWTDSAGNPSLDEQQPIVDVLPLQAGYSDFFEIILVTPPTNYKPNTIKSRATLLRSEYELTRTGNIINCPLVGPNTTLAQPNGNVLATYRTIQLWYRKKITHCITMEGAKALFPSDGALAPKIFTTPITDERNEYRVAASEAYTMLAKAFSGGDQASNIEVPQNDIFKYGPNSQEYSPLVKVWNVTVPSDYQNGELTSYSDLFPIPDFVDPRIEERSPEEFWNCSIVYMAN